MKPSPEPPARARVPRAALAWLVYAGVTVAAPAANGAWRRRDFAEHAMLTLAVSGALLGVWLVLARVATRSSGPRARLKVPFPR